MEILICRILNLKTVKNSIGVTVTHKGFSDWSAVLLERVKKLFRKSLALYP